MRRLDDLVLVDNASNAINVLLARLGLIDDPFAPAPTYAPGNGMPFRAPAANGHANGANNGFSESDLALL